MGNSGRCGRAGIPDVDPELELSEEKEVEHGYLAGKVSGKKNRNSRCTMGRF